MHAPTPVLTPACHFCHQPVFHRHASHHTHHTAYGSRPGSASGPGGSGRPWSGATSGSSGSNSRVASARPRSPLARGGQHGTASGAGGTTGDDLLVINEESGVSRTVSGMLAGDGDRPGTPGLAPEVLALLQESGLGDELLKKQRAWHSLKVGGCVCVGGGGGFGPRVAPG
jgi:hypothetical protein